MAAPLYSPDQSVAQALELHPAVSAAFNRRKTACIGCYLGRFCTLADVAATYEFELADLLGELQRAAHSDIPVSTGAQNG